MPRNPRPSEVAARIDAAADYIEKYGWRSSPSLEGEARCALLAVRKVTRSWRVMDEATAALGVQWCVDYGTDDSFPEGVGDWNDQQRDRRKVLRFMRRTARNVRNHKLVPTHSDLWPEWRFV